MGDSKELLPEELQRWNAKAGCAGARARARSRIASTGRASAGLDPVIASVIDELIISLSEKSKVTSITATHEMDSAFRIATRMAICVSGNNH